MRSPRDCQDGVAAPAGSSKTGSRPARTPGSCGPVAFWHMHTHTEGSTPLPDSVRRRLGAVLGPRGIIDDRDRLVPYESDALATERGIPRAALFPRNEDELAAALIVLHGAGIPFVPRGSGTGLSGGAVARDAVLVCTNRMDRILEVDPGGRRAVVEPGVVTDRITEAAAPHGLRYLPDPASGSVSSIGGNVAENAGGPHCLKHGVTTDHVSRLRLVLPHGRRITLDRGQGGGLDLAGLVVGSEGTLGVVSRIEVRLAPGPEEIRAALGLFDDIADAGRAVTGILEAGIVPVALELVDGATLRVVEESRFAAGLPTDVGAALLVESEGSPAAAEAEIRGAARVLRSCGARSVEIAEDEDARARLWHARKKAYGALGRLAPDIFVQDAAVPRSTLPELLPRIEEIARRHDVRLVNFFHAGDGNLHPNLVFDRRDPEQVRRVEAAGAEIMGLCVDAGGTITGEHGVGLDKKGYMRLIYGPGELAAFRRIRRAFDPEELCNPDKVIPEATEEEEEREDEEEDGPSSREGGSGAASEAAPEAPPGAPTDADGSEREIHHRPRDLVVSAPGHVGLDRLMGAVAGSEQWLPPAVGRGDLTVDQLVARAPAGPHDAAHGGLSRHLLEVRVEAPDGRRYRWGRPVVKNVAGYDLPRLLVGHRGRLGRVLEATFRLWPLPEAHRTLRLEPALEALEALAAVPPERDVLPEGCLWRDAGAEAGANAGGDGPEQGELRLVLAGSSPGVEERAERLAEWASGHGLETTGAARPAGFGGEDADGPADGADHGEEGATADPFGLRSAGPPAGRARAVLRARPGDPYLADAVRRIRRWRREEDPGWAALEAYPGTGVLRIVLDRGADEGADAGGDGDLAARVEALISRLPDAPWRLEHGPDAADGPVRERRSPRARELEERVVRALGASTAEEP